MRDDLLLGVNTVAKAVSTKTTMPILQCILIQARDGSIIMTANDMELGIETSVIGQVFEDGMVAVEAKVFSEIVRRLPNNNVSLVTDEDNGLRITCEKVKFSIPVKNPEEFTFLPEVDRSNRISISQFTLKEMVRQTIFSIAESESNPMMSGELLEVSGSEMRMVSLDGHRISIRKTELTEIYPRIKVIIPGKTLNEISKLLNSDTESFVNIFVTDRHILFEFNDTIVVSRLIEGEYFRVDQMLNNDYGTKITVNRKDMLNCIDRTTMLIKESDKRPIVIGISDTQMEVRLNSSIGSMHEELFIEKTGSDMMIGFNPKYLIEALRVIDEEEVDIYLISAKAPCFIRDKDQTYVYLILPVNFNVY